MMQANQGGKRRGVTLVEMLIVLGGMAVVAGLALQIYETANGASKKLVDRQSRVTAATHLLDLVTAKLRGIQPAANFDISEPDGLAFGHTSVTALFYLPETKSGLRIGTLGPDEKGAYALLLRDPRAVASVEPTREPIGEARPEFTPEVTFRYARSVKPGEPVVYVDSLPGDQWPAVIEVTLNVKVPLKGEEPITLRTAITTGMPRAEAKP